ncbi:MAG TPA: anaerobic ribonucleoside-triphosphate reductase activating protein [Firmicutes bacterium]|nr:anaerobic ribonucleoside-triphosphate reductase activating protein [Bacillota bacterium]
MYPLSYEALDRAVTMPGISLIDYPGLVASLIFLRGCNFRCPYCHNGPLLSPGTGIPREGLLKRMQEHRKLADGLVITGGEPTWGEGLADLIKEAKRLGYSVKLDTNGSSPSALEEILRGGWADYVAMDIKHTIKRYSEACGVNVDTDRIKKSVELIKKDAPDYEFRTTWVPGMHKSQDIEKMITDFSLNKSRRFILQKYIRQESLSFPDWEKEKWQLAVQPFEKEDFVFVRGDS